jgi:hypothetical protein
VEGQNALRRNAGVQHVLVEVVEQLAVEEVVGVVEEPEELEVAEVAACRAICAEAARSIDHHRRTIHLSHTGALVVSLGWAVRLEAAACFVVVVAGFAAVVVQREVLEVGPRATAIHIGMGHSLHLHHRRPADLELEAAGVVRLWGYLWTLCFEVDVVEAAVVQLVEQMVARTESVLM